MTDSTRPLHDSTLQPVHQRSPAVRPRRASITFLLLCVVVGAAVGLGAVMVGFGLSTLLL